MQPYPKIIDNTTESLQGFAKVISRYRDEDITDRNTFQSVFLSGRTVGKIPASSTDIASADRVGDMSFAVDGSYVYFCVNASGSAKWRRVALGTW